MSTIILDTDIEQIADALIYDAYGSRILRSVWGLSFTASLDEYKNAITAWANRVYIANQIAYILTYSHREDCDKSIAMLADETKWAHGGGLLSDYPRFYRTLESVQYNLYSNGGQVMLCAEDMQKYNQIMAIIAREIIGQYQKEKGMVR